ncbi:MAG TPA: SMI1/KNR4 family protein [Caulifigura sp.]|jgi:hypothetical protein|nr:SMI1/KNR4 family protein [Caulifigura sp.]
MFHRKIVFALRLRGPSSRWPKGKRLSEWEKHVVQRFPAECRGYRTELTVHLGDRQLPKIIDALETAIREDRAEICSGFRLVESLNGEEGATSDWYELSPSQSSDGLGNGFTGVPTITGTEQPRGAETVASFWPIVSDRFRRFVESRRWTGLSFLQLRDVGRYDGGTWHLAWSDEPLGDVLHHPWWRPDSKFELPPRADASNEARRILSKFVGMRVLLHPVCLRMHVPKRPRNHFAAVCGLPLDWTLDGNPVPSYVPGAHWSSNWSRQFLIRRDAKEELVANRLVKESECQRVLIFQKRPRSLHPFWPMKPPKSKTPPGFRPAVAKQPQRTLGEPLFPRELLVVLREEETRIQEHAKKHRKPPRKATLKRSPALLKARRRMDGASIARGATAKQLATLQRELPSSVPEAWLQVLKTSAGAAIENCELACGERCEIIAPGKLPSFAMHQRKEVEDLPEEFLPVVDSELGDLIGLNLAAVRTEGECPVQFYSHEENRVTREWPTIAEFLEDLLVGTEQGE